MKFSSIVRSQDLQDEPGLDALDFVKIHEKQVCKMVYATG